MKFTLAILPTLFLTLCVCLLSSCSAATAPPVTEPAPMLAGGAQPTAFVAAEVALGGGPPPAEMPTSEPPPTVLPEAWLYVIDLSDDNPSPSDLMEHLYYYIGGGAGGGSDEEPVAKPPYWAESYNNAIKAAVPGPLSWNACSLLETPMPQAVLTLPDGSTAELEVELSTFGEICARVSYLVTPGAPLGTYSLLVAQGDTELLDAVLLEMPTEPTHATYQDADWFAGFQPGESITVTLSTNSHVYSPYTPDEIRTIEGQGGLIITYLLKQEVITADRYGSFQIRVKTPDNYPGNILISVWGQSGALSLHPEDGWIHSVWPGICESPSRLQIGDTVQVTNYLDPLPSIMGPGRQGVVYLPAGTTMQVKLGPFCLYGWAWIVETADYGQILVDEGDPGGYFLEPVTP